MYNAFERGFAKIWASFKGRRWRNLRIRIDLKAAVKFQILDMGAKGKGKNVISLQMGHKEMIQTPKGHLPGGHKNHIELRTKDGKKMTIPHGGRAYLDPPNQNLPIKGKDY